MEPPRTPARYAHLDADYQWPNLDDTSGLRYPINQGLPVETTFEELCLDCDREVVGVLYDARDELRCSLSLRSFSLDDEDSSRWRVEGLYLSSLRSLVGVEYSCREEDLSCCRLLTAETLSLCLLVRGL